MKGERDGVINSPLCSPLGAHKQVHLHPAVSRKRADATLVKTDLNVWHFATEGVTVEWAHWSALFRPAVGQRW